MYRNHLFLSGMANGHTNPSYLPRPLPPQLMGLAELALDVRWNWNHAADRLWESIDPELWNATGNAWLILESVSHRRLENLATNKAFVAELERLLATKADYLARTAGSVRTTGMTHSAASPI